MAVMMQPITWHSILRNIYYSRNFMTRKLHKISHTCRNDINIIEVKELALLVKSIVQQ